MKPNGNRLVRKGFRTVGTKRVRLSKTPRGGIPKLTKALDAVYSRWLRISQSDANGEVSCFTCNYRAHYKKMQCGHFVSRFYKSVRWDERNTRVQCSMCNMWKNGDAANFRERLIAEIGEQQVLEVEQKRKELFKTSESFLNEKIAHYSTLLKELEAPRPPC